MLAQLAYWGTLEPQDFERAATFYHEAARHGDAEVRVDYYRFLANNTDGLTMNQQAVDWLREEAEAGSAEAMYESGNCHAKGCLDKPNYRKARDWYRKAVKSAPDDALLVNAVAWTLAVSDIKQLRNARYARRIMNTLMESNELARQSPQYLDTWAAAHAACGDFSRALELQNEALELAKKDANLSEEHLRAIETHLEIFSNREEVIESVP